MMHFTSKHFGLTLAAAGLVAAFGVQAEPLEMRVAGTITPPACTPSLTGGGVIDYGTIPVSSLSPTSPTVLGVKSISFSITCKEPTRVAIRVIDNRADSYFPRYILGISGLSRSSQFGLGMVRGKPIGAYGIQLQNSSFIIDGAVGGNRFSSNNGESWSGPFGGWVSVGNPSMLFSWSVGTTSTPPAFKTMASQLNVSTAIASTADLGGVTDDIELDGLATLEMVYL
ncbi:TPA: DUF1120 domain-containing protein [Pseudomonas aeruginosa]|nr:DUF1120 domain-containing protein [Pseudomonas aeruginosa]